MPALASEADDLSSRGEERPPLHKSHGGMACYACGGMVDAEGKADGYEAGDDGAENADGDTSQHAESDEMEERGRRSFIRAVRGGGR